MKYFAPPQNKKYQLLQILEATNGGVLQKKVFFKMLQNSQEVPVPEETPMNFAKFEEQLF